MHYSKQKGKALAIAKRWATHLSCNIDKKESKEALRHRRLEQFRENSLKKLANTGLINSLDNDQCIKGNKTCIGGKNHKSPIPTSTGTLSKELLGLVHSNA